MVYCQDGFGVAIAYSLVQQEAERCCINAVALTVGYVKESDALRLVHLMGEHRDFVIHQCAEH